MGCGAVVGLCLFLMLLTFYGGALLVSDAADFLWFLVPPPPLWMWGCGVGLCLCLMPPPPCGWVMGCGAVLWMGHGLWGCGGALLVSAAADFLWWCSSCF